MRGKGSITGIRLAAAAASLLVLLALGTASASASSLTNIGSFADPRTDLPARPGQLVRALYGPFNVPANGEIHNVPLSVPAPCTNCRITDMVPNLVFDGTSTTANMNNGLLLHHFVIFNPAQNGVGCPIQEPFFGAGNERTHLHLPTPFGYTNTAANWNMFTHVVNKSATPRTVNVEIIFRHRPLSETADTRPLWLDIDSICNGGNSEYTIPTGYSDTHVNWTSPVDGRLIGTSGHLHDIDIIDPNFCSVHCTERGGAIALSLEQVGGSNSTYYGPIPPNNPPPSDITGATLCRSEANHGTAFGASNGSNGHLDTDSICGINTDMPAGRQPEAYPAGGEWPLEGLRISAGQVLRLHSEYQNDSGIPKNDVMGIMQAWYVPLSAGYPRPKGATPLRVSLVPAYNPCTSPNRLHGPPDFPGNASNPDGSCNPPVQTSANLRVGTPDAAGGGAANFVGSVKTEALAGNTATTADEADVRYTIAMADIRTSAAGLPDYTGQLQVQSSLRITDRNNGPSETGTVEASFAVTVPCAGTASTTVGSNCNLVTTADAISPGTVKEGARANWQLSQVRVNDGGPDGNVATTPNSVFAVQGVFVP
jgi:hypothetical protein